MAKKHKTDEQIRLGINLTDAEMWRRESLQIKDKLEARCAELEARCSDMKRMLKNAHTALKQSTKYDDFPYAVMEEIKKVLK
jgi:hypothetical protein